MKMTLSDRSNFPYQEALRYPHLVAAAIEEIKASRQIILGPGVRKFEACFSGWLGGNLSKEHCIGVANGTDALELSLRCAGVQPGDNVIVPSLTAYATIAAILRIHAKPLFVDITERGSCLCPNRARHALSSHSNISAVIAVNLYGEACELDELQRYCINNQVALIEDCAQATGTTYRQEKVGTWGDYAAFSFYPTKNLAAMGDGGLLVVSSHADPSRLEMARRMRLYGWNDEREAVQFGVNSRLDEIQAWILLGKLDDLDQQIKRRRSIAELYREGLGELMVENFLTLPEDGDLWTHSYHQFVIQVEAARRDDLLQRARSEGIPFGVHYAKACHQHPYIIDRAFGNQDLRNTESLVNRILSLPMSPYLIEDDIALVCEFLSDFFRR
jgi:dTDP-4-amino-4,6-dideoxygalactose transaminase